MEGKKNIPLFQVFPELEKNIGYLEMGCFPTPIERLSKFEQKIASRASIYIKRDDLSCGLYGGNKVRKLEFTFSKILNQNYRKIITGGGLGSHMTIAVAVFGEKHKIPVDIVFFKQPLNDHVRKNLLLNTAFGANVFFSANYPAFAFGLLKRYLIATFKGEKPFLIIPGDSNTLSNLGYVNMVFELKEQIGKGEIPEPDYIFVAAGSCGTMAGLIAGVRLADLKTKVIGVQVSEGFVTNEKTVAYLANKTLKFLSGFSNTKISHVKTTDFTMFHDYLGQGYGYSVKKAEEAIEILNETEEIKLDPTYTGKAFAALMDFSLQENNHQKVILFINTYSSVDLSKKLLNINADNIPEKFRNLFLILN